MAALELVACWMTVAVVVVVVSIASRRERVVHETGLYIPRGGCHESGLCP